MKAFYNKKMTSSAVSLLLVTSSVISANALEIQEEGSIDNADVLGTEKRSSVGERSSVGVNYYKVTTDKLNLRKGPGTSYSIAGQVNAGDLVLVNQVSNGWAKITYGGSSSIYCSSKYLTKVDKVAKLKQSVYLRKSYSWDSSTIALLKSGEVAEVVAIGDYWSKLKYKGMTGYVAKQYLNVLESSGGSTSGSTSSSTQTATSTVQITEATYLRDKESWSANKLVLLQKNVKAELVSKGSTWSKLKYDGKTGYVANDYFKVISTSTSTGSSSSSSSTSTSTNGTVQITEATYLRDKESWSANKLVLLQKNVKAELLSKGSTWSKLKYDGKTGYVANDYFKVVSTSTSTGSSSSSSSSSKENGTITEATYLRDKESWSANKLLLLQKNVKVNAVSQGKDWTKVEYNGKTGYVANDFIKISSSVPSTNNETTTKYVVDTDSLNVRSGAGTSYSKVGSVKRGEIVDVYSISNGWAKIKFKEGVAYVSASYIVKQGSSSGSNTSNSKTLIYLDAGHGGKDPGAIGTTYGTKEKEATLDVSNRICQKLKDKGYTVKYSRNTDVYIPLLERTSVANNAGADLFVSVHFNSATTSSAAGLETLYKVDGRSSDVLANKVQSAMVNSISMKNRGLKTRSDLSVLNNSKMPAVLIEGGFLSNSSDENSIKSSSFRETLANAVVKGIEEYLKVSK